MHSSLACQKIIACIKGVSGPAAMKDQHKRQPRSQLSHPPLLSPSHWKPGKYEALCLILSEILPEQKSYQTVDLHATGDHGGVNVCADSAWDTAYVALDLYSL